MAAKELKGGAKVMPKRKKANNGYKLPDPIPHGEILTDITKKGWIIGSSIGVGGFGEIYEAAPYTGKTPKEYPSVIKIEPHGNGPLFVEMHFYMRNARKEDIDAWKKKKKLSSLGFPPFLGSGSHECNQNKYRFVVMERYGTDLQKLFLENNRHFPEHTVYQVALQIIDILEYIHSRTYVHADIKGGNLLLDRKTQSQVYLVDFGLAAHYTTKTEYKFDPKKAHNGTIEYTSRDAHMGVPTMRGDMEILAYNMIHWLCGKLPWENNLTDPSAVQKQKEGAFNDTTKFLKQCFPDTVPEPVNQFLTLLGKMKFNDTPDYDKFKNILIKGLKNLGKSPNGKLEFVGVSTNDEVKKAAAEKITTRTKDTPKKSRKKVEVSETKKVTSSKLKRPSIEMNNSANESMEMVINNTCISGDDIMKKVLSSIEPGADYQVQIRKKKKVEDKTETSESRPKKGNAKSSKGSKKVEGKKTKKQSKTDSDSEPEIISAGTRSRPQKQITPKTKENLSLDSEKDMFDDV